MQVPATTSTAGARERHLTSHAAAPKRFGHVPALDGLRGVAVLAVIGYHLGTRGLGGSGIPGFDGGFLGVDLFFVLSGFLITSLLLSEHRAKGRIDFTAFWLRRARRLLPALFLLLLVVAGYAATASPFVRGTLRWDIFASLAYVLNWRFVVSGQSYFDTLITPSPLRHLWSLAIEEQFYVLWPVLVGGALALVTRRGRIAARGALGVLLVATAGSAVLLAVSYRPADPSAAYYGTHTRVHELLIGAAAAAYITGIRRGTRRVSSDRLMGIAAVVGITAVAALMLTLTDRGSAYYYGGSVLFSVAAALVMVGVLDGRSIVARCLQVRPLAYIGGISYGLYLWHWPAIIWLSPKTIGLSGVPLTLLRLAFTAVAALLSFYLLERPVRSGKLRRSALRLRPALVSTCCCIALVVGATALTTRGAQAVPDYLTGKGGGLQRRPAGGPGATTGSVALIGDSVAVGLQPHFLNEAEKRGRASMASTFAGCEIGDLTRVGPDGKFMEGRDAEYCTKLHLQPWQKAIADFRPSVVFLHSRRDGYDLIDKQGRHLEAGSAAWLTAVYAEWDRVLAYLNAHGTQTLVLILPAFPVGETPRCESGRAEDARAQRCGAHLDKEGFMGVGPLRYAYRSWAAKHDAKHDNKVRLVDLDEWLCPERGKPCPKVIDGKQMRIEVDGIHFTGVGDEYVIPRIFDKAGVTSQR